MHSLELHGSQAHATANPTTLLLVLEDVDQSADVGQNLNLELIAVLQRDLGLAAKTDTRRGTGDDDGAGGQRRALGQEADDSGDAEDEVTGNINVSELVFEMNFRLDLLDAALLENLAVPQAAHSKLGRVRDEGL